MTNSNGLNASRYSLRPVCAPVLNSLFSFSLFLSLLCFLMCSLFFSCFSSRFNLYFSLFPLFFCCCLFSVSLLDFFFLHLFSLFFLSLLLPRLCPPPLPLRLCALQSPIAPSPPPHISRPSLRLSRNLWNYSLSRMVHTR